MSKQLYEEALADVKKLKEVAEDNAKRALLEAVTPRIKDLIENQLIGEMSSQSDEKDGGKILHDDTPTKNDEVDQNELDLESDDDKKHDEGVGKTVELSMESARSLGLLINSSGGVESHIRKLGRKIQTLKQASSVVKETVGYGDAISSTISEVENTYSYLQAKKTSAAAKRQYETILENYYATLKGLSEQKMTNRRRRNALTEADITLKLTGVPDDLELDDLGVDLVTGGGGDEDLGDEGGEDEDLDLDADEEEEGGDEGDEEEELDLDLGDEEEEGGEEEEEGGDEELDLDLGGEEEESKKEESRWLGGNALVEIDERMLRHEINRMRSLREADRSQKGHGPGDVSDDFADEDLGDPLDESDDDSPHEAQQKIKDAKEELQAVESETNELEESMDEYDEMHDKHVDEGDEDHHEGDEKTVEVVVDEADDAEEYGGRHGRSAEQVNHQSRQPGNTVESLQRQIRREIRIQMEAKKKTQSAKKQSKKLQGIKQEIQQTVKQSKRQGKGSPQTEKQAVQAMKHANKQQKKLAEAYNFFASRYNESVARANRLRGLLSEAVRRGSVINGGPSRSAGPSPLRTKLAETNLINTKLYFTNKLLQNESLTKRQKASVIERLDEARSDREVRLVYESLIGTLQGSSSGRLTESTNYGVMGSSSRPARPASTLNEGFETERWARLAGIVK